MAPSDSELLQAWRAGDESAGNVLFERHFRRVYRFFVTKLPDGVEDLVQRTFLACVHKRERAAQFDSFVVFLLGVARKELMMELRKRGRSRVAAASSEVGRAADSLAPTPTGALAARQEERLLLRALRSLTLDEQMLLELHYWEGVKLREIAEIAGVPVGTAKSRLFSARQNLRKALETIADDPAALASTLDDLDGWADSLRTLLSGPGPG